ncbi:MAG: Omp28-related outer membrane protein [Lentimicrobiaceae bacterium]|nr:Omp28-related outer membrane protein [Lentimicrobiaceae bacterium]
MKKLTLLMCAFAFLFKVSAQEPQFVSKEQQNRNVYIEELTGRLCGYCPGGQKVVNQIIADNPGRVFTANIHAASSLSPTNYPNLNTSKGAEIYNNFAANGIPCAVVNRSTATATFSDTWASATNAQLNQAAEVNVDGQVVINPATRQAAITVEAYYTADSKESTNYLTVVMLQDSILGSQSGASSNPAQVVNGQYCHMHILRDIITPTWGDQITPTTAGSLITKQYVYDIPEVIGSPNGVEVDLDNVHFIVFVTEKKQGTPTRPILNVAQLSVVQGTDDPIYPFIKSLTQENLITCTYEKKFTANVVNGGTEEITSLKFEVTVQDGETTTEEWTGSLPSYANVNVDLFAEIPFGEKSVEVKIVEANGQEFSFAQSVVGKCEEWIQVELGDTQATEEFKLELAQDRFGNQISWQVINHSDEVIASGGPYDMLSTVGTKVHEEYFTLPAGECAMFVIEDGVGNGINGAFGAGYYKIYDSKGNVLVESDGNYGHGEYRIIYTHGAMSVEDVVETSYNVYPNPVKDVLTVTGENMRQVEIYNSLGQLVKSISCNDDEVKINVNDMQNGMYFVNVIDNNGEMTTSKVSVLR